MKGQYRKGFRQGIKMGLESSRIKRKNEVLVSQQERLTIVDEEGNPLGVATRDEVHRQGHWHETFHCWVVSREPKGLYLYFQLRSTEKKDFPNRFDVAAAGHLLAGEKVADGVREVEEELGLSVTLSDLIPLGVVKDRLKIGKFLDNERCHVFLYENKMPIDAYQLQQGEVSGIVKTEFQSFYELCQGKREEVLVEGYKIGPKGKVPLKEFVPKSRFVPHEPAYFKEVMDLILGRFQQTI